MPLPPDARLGPYHVLGKIGVGGMGEVYPRPFITCRRASAGYTPSQRPALRAVFGTDIGMTALLWRAMGLWFVGRISEAEEVHASGLAMALEDSTRSS
jgi:hypothetical protein